MDNNKRTTINIIFESVSAAMRNLEEGDVITARKQLRRFALPILARLILTDDDAGHAASSPFGHELIKALENTHNERFATHKRDE